MARLSKSMISFIVPAYNEEHELSGTLAAIHAAASKASASYEIIVVDDASTDATPEIASRAGAKVIRINRRHIAASRNAGGRAAQGEYLFFIDADTRINRAHITGAIAAMDAGYAGGSARVNMDGLIPIWGRWTRSRCMSIQSRRSASRCTRRHDGRDGPPHLKRTRHARSRERGPTAMADGASLHLTVSDRLIQ